SGHVPDLPSLKNSWTNFSEFARFTVKLVEGIETKHINNPLNRRFLRQGRRGMMARPGEDSISKNRLAGRTRRNRLETSSECCNYTGLPR
ncbi:MAG: hypothetical protein ACRES7_10140, partial [Gammaproteobacteria bacterium]